MGCWAASMDSKKSWKEAGLVLVGAGVEVEVEGAGLEDEAAVVEEAGAAAVVAG